MSDGQWMVCVSLGQVAEIVGPDPEQVETLRGLELGHAPLPGQSSWVHPGQVETCLQRHDWKAAAYELTYAGPVKVTRNFATVSPDQIKAAVAGYIDTQAPWAHDQMKIRPIRYQQSHRLPPGKLSIQVRAPKHTDWLGAIPFKVFMLIDGQPVKQTSVPAYIEVWQDVVLAAKPLGRNQPITSTDIRIQKMNLARLPAKAVVRPDQVLGKRARRSIAVNSVLRTDQVEAPVMIRKGDIVQVLAESKVLRVTTQAQAKQNGGIGDHIEVMNLRSKKNFYAQIVDAQTVKVDF